MKKTEKYIYLVLGIILVVVIACGITYMIATNKKTEIKEKQRITISEDGLKEYLKYVPKDIMNENQNMYINPQNSDDLSTETLLGATLNYADNYTDLRISTELGDEFLFSKEKINELMQKMYNKKIPKLEDEIKFGCVFYSEYDNNNYIQSGGCGSENIHLNKIDSYLATEGELIITEYAAYYDSFENTLNDYYTNKETDLGGWCGNTSSEEKIEILDNYLDAHKDEFTLYKHTFKKNDTGYYWYSTEIASEG